MRQYYAVAMANSVDPESSALYYMIFSDADTFITQIMYHPLEKTNVGALFAINIRTSELKILVLCPQQDFNTRFKLLNYLSILVTPKCVIWQTVKT